MKYWKQTLTAVLAILVFFFFGLSQAEDEGDMRKEGTASDEVENLSDGVSYDEKAETILQTGAPKEVLSRYSPSRIDHLYESIKGRNVVYCGSKITFLTNMENGLEIEPRAQIRESDLMLNLDFYEVLSHDPSNYGAVESLILEYSFEWQTIPFCQFTDAFTINWDANRFRPAENNYFYAISEFRDGAGNYRQIDCLTKPGLIRDGGIGWTLRIHSAMSDGVASVQYPPSGGGCVILASNERILSTANHTFPQREKESEYMDVHFEYAHQKIGGEIYMGIAVSETGFGNFAKLTFTRGNYSYLAGFARYQFKNN